MARQKKAVRRPEEDAQWSRLQRCHNLDTSALEQLASEGEGDEVAESVLQFRMMVKDLATNPRSEYDRPQLWLAPHLWLEFKRDRAGRVRVWLEMTESLTVEVIKTHFSKIRRWQRLLKEWQGPERGGRDEYLTRINQRHEKGLSCAKLADDVAMDVVSSLEVYRRMMGGGEFEQALRRIDSWSDEEVQHWKDECSVALSHFRYVGVSDEDSIRKWWLATLRTMVQANLQPGISPPENPLTDARVREALRTFRGDRNRIKTKIKTKGGQEKPH